MSLMSGASLQPSNDFGFWCVIRTGHQLPKGRNPKHENRRSKLENCSEFPIPIFELRSNLATDTGQRTTDKRPLDVTILANGQHVPGANTRDRNRPGSKYYRVRRGGKPRKRCQACGSGRDSIAAQPRAESSSTSGIALPRTPAGNEGVQPTGHVPGGSL